MWHFSEVARALLVRPPRTPLSQGVCTDGYSIHRSVLCLSRRLLQLGGSHLNFTMKKTALISIAVFALPFVAFAQTLQPLQQLVVSVGTILNLLIPVLI